MFPKYIWIAEHKYKLNFKRLDENDRGECNSDKSEINVDTHNASITQIIETVFHEVSHAFSEHFGLQPKNPEDVKYEHIISCCGKAMSLFVLQNQDLVRHVLVEVGKLTKEERRCSGRKKKSRKNKNKK